ncbi:Bud20 protein [Pichia kluyveri]|uniref:Bud20 protein n=1 Tax=Pichia kluyveri TaxID=36015 RepID=A0AAV5QZJ2_PICKL|nr:Bud20 protein [Pichia kluyveri]
MGRYSVKRYKTKRRTKDLDLIFNELSNPETIQKLKQQPEDENLPGLGQYYCIHCSKYFFDNTSLKGHLRGKVHKRRVKELSVNPYTNLESEAATGTNLEKFFQKVQQYKDNELSRKNMETEMLKDQTNEYDVRDEQKWAEMYPEKAQEKALKEIQEAELIQKRAIKKAKKFELEPLTDDEIEIDN